VVGGGSPTTRYPRISQAPRSPDSGHHRNVPRFGWARWATGWASRRFSCLHERSISPFTRTFVVPPAGFEPATHGLGIGLQGCQLASSSPVWPAQLQFSSRSVTSRSAESFAWMDNWMDSDGRRDGRPGRPVASRRVHSRSRARRCRRGRIELHPGSLTPAVAASQEARRHQDRAVCIDAVPTPAMCEKALLGRLWLGHRRRNGRVQVGPRTGVAGHVRQLGEARYSDA
jgi:hypothetical protein